MAEDVAGSRDDPGIARGAESNRRPHAWKSWMGSHRQRISLPDPSVAGGDIEAPTGPAPPISRLRSGESGSSGSARTPAGGREPLGRVTSIGSARSVADRPRRLRVYAVSVGQLGDEFRLGRTVVAVGERDELRLAEWPAWPACCRLGQANTARYDLSGQ